MAEGYDLIRRAIALDEAAPPAELAAALGMRLEQFRDAFSEWAGVPAHEGWPYLHPRVPLELLRRGAKMPAAEPPQALWHSTPPKRMIHGAAQTPYGLAIGLASETGLVALGFAAEQGEAAVLADLCRRWPDADIERDDERLAPMIARAIAGEGPLHVIGTPFQIRVWQALLALPEGAAVSYGTLAERIGRPRAARAVGTAVGRNPLSAIIPCHRVLRADGTLGGYHWGKNIKRAMLARESARHTAAGA